jgi:tetratricopeptide (TPR) repeat protein/predicted aspartyl protease
MRARDLIRTCLAAAVCCTSAHAATKCTLGKLAELPVTMNGFEAIVRAQINGTDARFIVDSGAFYSMLSPAAAAEFKLNVYSLAFQLYVEGIGGRSQASAARVKEFRLAGVPIPKLEFIVAGNDFGSQIAGLLGQNVLSISDVEYDLSHGAIRFFKPHDCQKTDLAYWAGNDPHSYIDIQGVTQAGFHTVGTAFVNGIKMKVGFDTGATSMLTLRAAERAGIKPDSPGVVPGGTSYGVGRGLVKTWVAPVDSFKIGEEEIKHPRLRVGDFTLPELDMLAGADFFLSHRIYVSNSQNRLFLSYNGGPVFYLATHSPTAAKADEQPPADKDPDEPTDAPGYSRRGSAFAARRDYEHAIADFNRACELDPGNAEYFYQRATALWRNKQLNEARKDLDKALALKPDHVQALLTRAQLHFGSHEDADAVKDLDAAEKAAPQQDAARLEIAGLYEHAELFTAAIRQYDLWIGAHGEDVLLANALNGRCWARALAGTDLNKALDDCNRAVKLNPKSAAYLDSRGLVRLRLGQYDKSIADYTESLQLRANNPWSLYGRGMGRLKKGQKADGDADLAAATALQANIADEFKKHGIAP